MSKLPEGEEDLTRVAVGQQGGQVRELRLWREKGVVVGRNWEGYVVAADYKEGEEEVEVALTATGDQTYLCVTSVQESSSVVSCTSPCSPGRGRGAPPSTGGRMGCVTCTTTPPAGGGGGPPAQRRGTGARPGPALPSLPGGVGSTTMAPTG